MIISIVTFSLVACSILSILYMVYLALVDFPERTVVDVVEFLRPVDLAQAEVFLDPSEDYELKWKLDAKTLREVQRKRARIYLEMVRRMSHNARVLVEFGNWEATRRTGRVAEVIGVLQKEAIRVRMYSFLTIVELNVLLAMRPLQTPSLMNFRVVFDIDGISSYKGLREASTAVFKEFKQPVDKLVLSF
jgi:hypothetical protein